MNDDNMDGADMNMIITDGGSPDQDELFKLRGFTNVAKPDVADSKTPGDVEAMYENYINEVRQADQQHMDQLKEEMERLR